MHHRRYSHDYWPQIKMDGTLPLPLAVETRLILAAALFWCSGNQEVESRFTHIGFLNQGSLCVMCFSTLYSDWLILLSIIPKPDMFDFIQSKANGGRGIQTWQPCPCSPSLFLSFSPSRLLMFIMKSSKFLFPGPSVFPSVVLSHTHSISAAPTLRRKKRRRAFKLPSDDCGNEPTGWKK